MATLVLYVHTFSDYYVNSPVPHAVVENCMLPTTQVGEKQVFDHDSAVLRAESSMLPSQDTNFKVIFRSSPSYICLYICICQCGY